MADQRKPVVILACQVMQSLVQPHTPEREDIPTVYMNYGLHVRPEKMAPTLQEQLEIYPWIQFVRVKVALSADDAELRPLPEVHEDMRASAQKAVENLSSAKALKLVNH